MNKNFWIYWLLLVALGVGLMVADQAQATVAAFLWAFTAWLLFVHYRRGKAFEAYQEKACDDLGEISIRLLRAHEAHRTERREMRQINTDLQQSADAAKAKGLH